ncbi:MAG: hypothetical protein HZB21_00380 [Deltaproteobacteria bacterium]|nr:hypothetical protein [Deltaproteobacteria bacterium]
MAKRVGFIDIRGLSPEASIYIFSFAGSGFELEKTFQLSAGDGVLPFDVMEAGEFYLSLPLQALSFRLLKFAFSDRDKLAKVIPFELDPLIIGGRESVVFDFIRCVSPDAAEVLVCYIEKEALRGILGRFSALNADPRVVTSIELRAVLNAQHHFPAETSVTSQAYEAESGAGHAGIAGALLDAPALDDGGRVSAARDEALSPSLNLRMGELAYTKDKEGAARSLKMTAALSIMLALVIIGGIVLRTVHAKRETSAMRGEVRSIYSSLFPEEKRITDELYQMKSHIKEIRDKGEAMKGSAPLQFLLDLAARKAGGVALNEVMVEKGAVSMKGEAASTAALDAMRKRLDEFLSEVTITDIRPAEDGRTLFTVISKGRR